MSDEAPEQSSKTEDPSDHKMREAHKRGDVVKSQEVNTWFVLAGSTLVFAGLAGPSSSGLATALGNLVANADRYEVGGPALTNFWIGLAGSILLVALIPLLVLTAFAVAANLIQHRPLLSLDPIKPKLSKISPIEGFKRLFSVEALVNFGKGLVKLALISAVLWFVLRPELDRLDTMVSVEPVMILADFQELALKILGAVLAAVTLMAIADYVYQRQRWWKRQMMTVQETRDEYKQMEGDPKVKGRIRQLRQERGRRRMMAEVPNATLVVTNPTHYAVALRYDRTMSAPKCVAKGADAVALRIRELAREHEVPVIENPPLARALFASVEVDQTIPTEHFKAVAELIGYVMQLKQKRGWAPG